MSIRIAAALLAPLSFLTAEAVRGGELAFGERPVWTSGSERSGGDGNARWIDFDRDGDPDLVTSAPNPRRWVLFANDGGKLSSEPTWSSLETTDCDHIAVLDFDGDGWEDLAATHESHCTLYLNRAGRGDVPFGERPDWETGLYTDANQVDFGDFDADGDADMLMASGLPLLSAALFVNEGRYPSRRPSGAIGPRLYSESSIFADWDSDGRLDVIASYPKTGAVLLFRGEGKAFAEAVELYRDERVTHVQRAYCVDLDGDGANELFLAKGPWGPPGASVGLKRREGAEELEVIWRSGEATGFHGFDFADADGDGDLDMAAADWARRSVSIYLQEGGKLAAEPTWAAATGSPAHEVEFADLDGDGDLDLAAGCLAQAMVFLNEAQP